MGITMQDFPQNKIQMQTDKRRQQRVRPSPTESSDD
ncbi:hypothetical protein V6Z12_A05G342000 [Gossypium hirsutum]